MTAKTLFEVPENIGTGQAPATTPGGNRKIVFGHNIPVFLFK